MGIQLSESTNKTGLYELFQDLTGTNPTSYSLYKFVRDANNALGNFNLKALMASQKWEHDDTNHLKYPIILLDIVSGQQDYPITNDGEVVPNQILDILRIELTDNSGVSRLLNAYDISERGVSITQQSTATGIPTEYDKLANGIWLNPVPNFSRASAMKVYTGRTPVYFIGDGTSPHNAVVPGIPDPFHEYLVYLPAYLYCVTKLPKLANGYLAEVQRLEQEIFKFYFWRNRDEKKRMVGNVENNK